MPGSDFLGTNVLVYAYDASDRAKQRIAQSLVRRAIAAEMVTSTQALAEFAATLLQKLSPAARPAARPADVAAILDMLGAIIAIRRMPTVSGEGSRRTPNTVPTSTMEKFWRQQNVLLARESYLKISTRDRVIWGLLSNPSA